MVSGRRGTGFVSSVSGLGYDRVVLNGVVCVGLDAGERGSHHLSGYATDVPPPLRLATAFSELAL
jgi:hypothetical protein